MNTLKIWTGLLATLLLLASAPLRATEVDTTHAHTTQHVAPDSSAHDTTTHAATHGSEHAAGGHTTGAFDMKELLFGHVMDSHEWHITDIHSGDGHYTPVALHLPYIIWNSATGLEVFMLGGHTHHELAESAAKRGYTLDAYGYVTPVAAGVTALDFSITKNVLHMLMVSVVLLVVFIAVARSARRNTGKAPTGMQNFFEPIILFIRDEVAKPNMHGKHAGYVPYLLTLFFFIWFANLFGLTPFNSNIAGNTAFTLALASLTFLITQFSGTKDHWAHIFWFPGVSVPVKLLMLIVEFLGLFTKPFALTVRLFANIAAGHLMVLSLIGLIFIMNSTYGVAAGAGVAPLSMAFTLFIMAVEFIVAIVQAYIFTLLTAVFIGQAMESHDHAHADHGHHDAH